MALSTADLQAAYLRGSRFVTVNAAGVVTEAHPDYAAALKAGGHPSSSVSKLASNGTLTANAQNDAHRHNYGKAR